jgi:hypothetical protein
MYAIARNIKLQRTNGTPWSDWCEQFITKDKFTDEKGYVVENITKKNNVNPRFLSQIEVGNFSDDDIEFNGKSTGKLKACLQKSLMPFGVPKNANHTLGCIIECIYNNGPHANPPEDNITGSVLMSFLRNIVYQMSRKERCHTDVDLKKEKHHIRILLSLYHQMKMFMEGSNIIKSLAKGLADCVSTRDVAQREIAIILNGNELTDDVMDQLLTVAFSRSNKYFKEDQGKDKQFTMTIEKYLKAKFGLFFIIPLLKYSTEYSEASVDKFSVMLNECYSALYDSHILNKLTDDDSGWQITSELCKIMYNIMIDKCNLKIAHKNNQYFIDLLTKVTNTKLEDIEDVICKSANEICKSIKIKHSKSNNASSCFPYSYQRDDNSKLTFRSPRLTKWSTFEVNLDNDKLMGLSWKPMINAKVGTMVEPEIRFLGYDGDKTVINDNSMGCYSPIMKTLSGKHLHEKIEGGNNCVLIHRHNNNVEIFTDGGKIVFSGKQIIIAFKNIDLDVDIGVTR